MTKEFKSNIRFGARRDGSDNHQFHILEEYFSPDCHRCRRSKKQLVEALLRMQNEIL